jgi:phosphatidylglycerol:prolipoprotein diacylglycerol transferase
MHPVLFQIGPLTIHTYGFFVAMGVLAAIFFAKHEAKRLGMDPEKIVDLCFYVVTAAIAGSRLLYVLTNLRFFIAAPLEIFKIWNGGLVFYGGFIAAVIVAISYIKIQHLPLGKCTDIGALSIPLGHSLGRLGCFSAGCCYGKSCELPWAITFHNPLSLAPLNIPIHPTQLYSFAANLLIFLCLFFFRTHKRYDGQIFWLYVLLYGILRSVIEVYRGDFRGAFIFNTFSISQVFGIGFAFLAVVMLIILQRRSVSKER